MMTFFAAAGSYVLAKEGWGKVPYLQVLGRQYAVSGPVFGLWRSAMWQVLSYEELKEAYREQACRVGAEMPDLDALLEYMVEHRFLLRGEGYTGMDALRQMLRSAFVSPVISGEAEKVRRAADLLRRGKINWNGFLKLLEPEDLSEEERAVLHLVRQTPLSTAELIRCWDYHIRDVHTQEGKNRLADVARKEEEGEAVSVAFSPSRDRILETVASLFLKRHVLLEQK